MPVPIAAKGEAIVQVRGSSVNPVNLDFVEPNCARFRCVEGIPGDDLAGVIVSVGPECDLQVGDEVWGGASGTYAPYAKANCSILALKPKSLTFAQAGTMPVAAGTSYQCLLRAGLPSQRTNLTVVVTSGQGGTGYLALQFAKAMGAARVVTSATGDGIALTKSLGADVVVDYHVQDLFDYLPDDSVDIVFDNLGTPGTADRAMRTIKTGGTILVLPGGNGGKISDHPKAGVTQIPFGSFKPSRTEFDELAKIFDQGQARANIFASYGLHQVSQAWTALRGHGVLGKIAVDPTNLTSLSLLV